METNLSEKEKFFKGLTNKDISLLNQVAKSDLHSHADRAANRKDIEEEFNILFENPPIFKSINDMDNWYNSNIDKYTSNFSGLLRRYISMFKTAERQNIKVFSPSFCLSRRKYFNGSCEEYINFIKQLKDIYAPNIEFYPELVLNRNSNLSQIEEEFKEASKYDFFKSIDIIGDEKSGVDKFIDIYQEADKLGWILKSHVGEFGGIEEMEDAIDKLNLDVINHGIAAVKSNNMILYLKKSGIKLNICPSSNILLSRVKCYKDHPIGTFVKEGITCSINTDDLLIFNQTINDEYLNLYNNKTLSLEELNKVREDGLTKFLVKRKEK